MKKTFNTFKINSSSGFSLIELLVVISIFTIITSVVLVNQSRFSSDIVITNLAYEIALEVRQAQTYGIAVRGTASADNPALLLFKQAYGVHFGTAPEGTGGAKGYNPATSFAMFADIDQTVPNNGLFDNVDESVDVFRLPGGNSIVDFCYGDLSLEGQWGCHKAGGGTVTSMDITFTRPKPDAHFRINGQTEEVAGPATITVESSLGDKCKQVVVESTGQIAVNPNTVPCP